MYQNKNAIMGGSAIMLCTVNCSKKLNLYLGLGKQIVMIELCLFFCVLPYKFIKFDLSACLSGPFFCSSFYWSY